MNGEGSSGPWRNGAYAGEVSIHGGRCGAVIAMMACRSEVGCGINMSSMTASATHREASMTWREVQPRCERLSTEHPRHGRHLVEEDVDDVLRSVNPCHRLCAAHSKYGRLRKIVRPAACDQVNQVELRPLDKNAHSVEMRSCGSAVEVVVTGPLGAD